MSSNIDVLCLSKNAELTSFQQELHAQRKKYMKYKLIQDILIKMTNESVLDRSLSEKVKDILIFQDAMESEMFSLLGLKVESVTPSELTFQEQCKLKSAFESYIYDYYQHFKTTYPDLMQANLSLSIHDQLITDLKEKLNLRQEEDLKGLGQISLKLDELIKLRTEELPKILDKKSEEYELKMKIMDAKYKVLHYRLKLSIFTETDKCFEAYKELVAHIEKQKEECRKNIEQLTIQKQKYAVVQSKEYNDILKAYLQYKSLIEEKKALLQKLQNKL